VKTPLVSVVMPAYNCKPYIQLAVESIINQTYKNLEIIIVDDFSIDGTWEEIQKLAKTDSRIIALRNNENSKIVKTLNKGIDASKGEYIARMDGDDERMPKSIEHQVSYLQKHPDVAIVGGSSELCDVNMNTLNIRRYNLEDEAIREKIFRYSPFTHATVVMRRSMMPEEKYQLDWAEDYDLYFRLGKNGKFANLEEVVYRIRTHSASVSRSKTRYQEKLTLYIRLKAVFEYGYQMTRGDKFYFAMQFITMYLMPGSFRFWLFNKVRGILR
jgi:glycosyltransferase involved in cell wall biosynthesis